MIKIKKLKNGAKIVVDQNDCSNGVCAVFCFKVGSIVENSENEGICHFIEHIMFSGTTKRPKEKLKSELDQVGSIYNASTDIYNTMFYIENSKEYFEKSFSLMCDMLSNTSFDENMIEIEKGVIGDEIDRDKTLFKTNTIVNARKKYYEKSVLNRSILGTRQTINKFDKSTLFAFYQKYYSFSNLVISFGGNIDIDTASTLVDKYLRLCGSGIDTNMYKMTDRLTLGSSGLVKINMDLSQSHLVLAFDGLNELCPDFLAYDIAVRILGYNSRNRLFDIVRDKLGLVYNISAFAESDYNSGISYIHLSTGVEKINESLVAVKNVLDDFIKNGITSDELSNIKTNIDVALTLSKDNILNIATINARDMAKLGKVENIEDLRKRYSAVTIKKVNSVIKKIWGNGIKVISYTGKDIDIEL